MPDRRSEKTPADGDDATEPARPRRIADEPVAEVENDEGTVKSPVTGGGLPVEEQVRKEWDPNKDGGLPTPLRRRRR